MRLHDIRQHMKALQAPNETQAGDHLLNPGIFDTEALQRAKPAAVLIPIIERRQGTQLLLTERSEQLRTHSGQVAFPGGRIDAGESPLQTALRETYEEVGIDSKFIAPIAQMPPYLTGTGYLIHPIIAEVAETHSLKLNRAEVRDAFEVPLNFLLDEANHQTHSRIWNGQTRYFYAMPYQQHYIWGVTAGIIRAFCERLKS